MIFIAVLMGHQSLEVIDRDEARFAQASKQMVLSGDLITPYFMDELRAKKPIAIYWLQSASAAIFGHFDIASYRLPSVLGVLVALFLTFRLAASMWPAIPLLPTLSVLLLAATPVMIGEAHLAKTDAVLLAAILCQQFYLWRLYQRFHNQDPPPTGLLFMGFWVFMAIGVLVKGPIAPLIALTTILTLVAIDRQIKWLAHLAFFRGILVLAAITLPWMVAVSYQTDGAFLDIAIRGDFLSKVRSGQESHGAPFGTYFGLVGLLFWPGIAFAGFLFRQGLEILQHPPSGMTETSLNQHSFVDGIGSDRRYASLLCQAGGPANGVDHNRRILPVRNAGTDVCVPFNWQHGQSIGWQFCRRLGRLNGSNLYRKAQLVRQFAKTKWIFHHAE